MNIILVSNHKKPPIDSEHVFVTVGPNCWGKGNTPEEALKNCKANAPYGYRGKYLTRVAPKDFQIDQTDGSVLFLESHNAKLCPYCTVGKGIKVLTGK